MCIGWYRLKPHYRLRRLLGPVLFTLWLPWAVAVADEFDELRDLERLMNIGDEEYRHIADAAALEFPPFLHDKTLILKPANLSSPWVDNIQCHANFPTFPSLQISFKQDAVRGITITHSENVPEVWVEGPTVQMKRTTQQTRLCFTSENNTFEWVEQSGLYHLGVGPYYLRLFDGFFDSRHVFECQSKVFLCIELAATPPKRHRRTGSTQTAHHHDEEDDDHARQQEQHAMRSPHAWFAVKIVSDVARF